MHRLATIRASQTDDDGQK